MLTSLGLGWPSLGTLESLWHFFPSVQGGHCQLALFCDRGSSSLDIHSISPPPPYPRSCAAPVRLGTAAAWGWDDTGAPPALSWSFLLLPQHHLLDSLCSPWWGWFPG